VDVPTSSGTDTGAGGEVRGNYATFNPLWKAAAATTSNGNLDCVCNGSGSGLYGRVNGTIGVSSGKFYWEVTFTSSGTGANIGIALNSTPVDDFGAAVYNANGNIYPAGTAYGATYTQNDIIGVALNMDAGTLVFYKNGVSQGTAFSSLSGTYFPSVANGGGNATFTVNFGQRSFAYTAPSGFKALCTTNLPAPLVTKPSTVFNIVNETTSVAGSAKTISGLAFEPDLVISKLRNQSTNARWGFIDQVRGVNKTLASDRTDAEVTSQSDLLTQFNSNGFNVGADAAGYGWNYQNGGSLYTYWAWDAGSSTVTNTQGSITNAQVRANPTAGFSIVTYTGNGTAGATVGHGLGAKPFLRIIKRRDAASTIGWMTFHESAQNVYFTLNSTNASTPASEAAPTSTVFSLPSDANSNANGGTYVAYLWAPVVGYSS
ncbi:hypothetical protein EBZ39_18125, partial [bacterium]|nr:hypothetical protein [bacterium]